MELRAEEGLSLVSDTLVSTVVDVREQRLPPLTKLAVIDREPVVLGRDVALVRQAVHDRLRIREREGMVARADYMAF